MPVDTITVQTTIHGIEFGLDASNRPVARLADGKQYGVVLHNPTTNELIGANGALVSGGAIVAAPATLDASNVATYNGGNVSLAAAGTLTVSDAAWAGLTGGLTINVGQGGSATLAFSGTATKENASGSSASSVTLAASGVYVLLQSPTGTPKFRLSGGASL